MYAAYRQMRAQLRHQSELEMKRLEQHYLDRLLEVTSAVTDASLDFLSAVGLSMRSHGTSTEIVGHGTALRLALRRFGAAARACDDIVRASRRRRLGDRQDTALEEFRQYLDAAREKNIALAHLMLAQVMNIVTTGNFNEIVADARMAGGRLSAVTAALIASMFSPNSDETATLGDMEDTILE